MTSQDRLSAFNGNNTRISGKWLHICFLFSCPEHLFPRLEFSPPVRWYCISPLPLPLPQGPCCKTVPGCEDSWGGDIWPGHLLLWGQGRLLPHSQAAVSCSVCDVSCACLRVQEVCAAHCSEHWLHCSKTVTVTAKLPSSVMLFLCQAAQVLEKTCQAGKRGWRVAAAVEGEDEISWVLIPPSEDQTKETTLTFSMFPRAG